MPQADQRLAALERGARAEAWVCSRLVREGWTLLDQNWRGGGGELDLVVCREHMLRFVEVKARVRPSQVLETLVGPAKRVRLERAAEAWLADHPGHWTDLAFALALVSMVEPIWALEFLDDAFDSVV